MPFEIHTFMKSSSDLYDTFQFAIYNEVVFNRKMRQPFNMSLRDLLPTSVGLSPISSNLLLIDLKLLNAPRFDRVSVDFFEIRLSEER